MVLAGGASRRFGRDKALVEVDGSPMAARVRAALLDAGASEVLAVGGARNELEAMGFRWVEDRWPGEGPLGGLITGLGAVRVPRAVVCACDLPALDPGVIRQLCGAADATSVLVPVVDGRRQPLAAVYPTALRPPLEEVFLAGTRSMREALTAVPVIELVVDDPTGALADIDRPDDLDG